MLHLTLFSKTTKIFFKTTKQEAKYFFKCVRGRGKKGKREEKSK